MDLTTVRWFLTVAELGHVTQAAAELRISQPGLSRAMARLGRELGVPLFDREGRTLRLSPYGTVFREHAERLVAQEEAARRALAQAADPGRGEVGLAFLHTQGMTLVPELLRDYRQDHPQVTFRLSQGSSEQIQAAVVAGRADLAITSPQPVELAWHPLVSEQLHLAVPPGHPIAGRERVRLAEAVGEPFIVMRHGYGLRSITEKLFAREGIRPDIAFEGEEAATLRGLVAAGLGVAVVPPGEPMPGVSDVAIAGARRTIGLVWVAGRTRPPVVEDFRRFVVARAG